MGGRPGCRARKKRAKALYKTTKTDPATIKASPAPVTFRSATAFEVESGIGGVVLVAATMAELAVDNAGVVA